MNSYPAELLMQLAPVMFVAGIEKISPQPSAGISEALTPTSPSMPSSKRANQIDPFVLLMQRLREMLGAQRKPAVWVPESLRKSKTFYVVFVDKTAQFPPRKIPDPTSSQPPHSPLSPLHPSSPLHPDGIIAPIWVRKHTTLVPSVFVYFLRLFENQTPLTSPRSPLEPEGPDVQKEREEREREDRKYDAELAQEIADRKRGTSERGMKLTVVLLASRKMLDDPALDARLTFIRRTSGLDSRAALFVLSPVAPAELAEFVKSLQQALYDPAIEYYTAHAKRVRRKRNRHATSSLSRGSSLPGSALPLRPEGWTVRYEYKMACFAEFRGEEEVALKHYQDSYAMLVTMFGSPAILPPRTKRWAEAKVLADSINIKICKLFLYNAEHALALAQMNSHVRRFSDLSARVWGIGEETFEYWSWLARQYRAFSELLEQGIHYSLPLPNHLPASMSTSSSTQSAAQREAELGPDETLQALGLGAGIGLNPNTALMHPGFYYYIAAECTERRRMKYLKALENEAQPHAPGFQNEKKVDHLASILELYTKAYDLFKKYGTTPPPGTNLPEGQQNQNQLQNRFTVWIADRIARTYFISGKFDMANKFFERIVRSYSRDKWDHVLLSLLESWYTCVQQLGDIETSVKLIIEMITRGSYESVSPSIEGDVRIEDLNAILKSTVPSSPDPIMVDLRESIPFFDSTTLFWNAEALPGEKVPFQICLTSPPDVNVWGLPIKEVKIKGIDENDLFVVSYPGWDEAENERLERNSFVDVGEFCIGIETETKIVEGNLCYGRGSSLVLSGIISSTKPRELQFSNGELLISTGIWNICVPFKLARRQGQSYVSPKWMSGDPKATQSVSIRRPNASSLLVKNRPHQVEISFKHHSPSFLDESCPITVVVTNNDEKELQFTLDVLLQPGDDDSVNVITVDGEQSSGLIKGILIGKLQPGTTTQKVLRLLCTGSAGDRMVDVSVQSHAVLPSTSETEVPETKETFEILRTIVVPAVSPFIVTHKTSYSRCNHNQNLGPADLYAFETDHWDDSEGGRAFISTLIECAESLIDNGVIIEGVELIPHENKTSSRIVHSSLENNIFPEELFTGDQLSFTCELSLAPPHDFYSDPDASLPAPGFFRITWRRTASEDSLEEELISTTQLTLPKLIPPTDGLVALLSVPVLAELHKPFLMTLTLRNLHPSRTAYPSVVLDLESTSGPSNSAVSGSNPGQALNQNLPTPSVNNTEGLNFVASGIRKGRLSALIPGAEETIMWSLVPLECGETVKLPKLRVVDRRKSVESGNGISGTTSDHGAVGHHEAGNGSNNNPTNPNDSNLALAGVGTGDLGDDVRVIDVRWDQRNGTGIYLDASDEPGGNDRWFTICVTPIN